MAILEMALSVADRGGASGIRQGDLIVVRQPEMGVGLEEMSRFLWLWVNLNDIAGALLMAQLEDTGPSKRRYHIPLQRLAQVRPDVDMGRVTDVFVKYQPLVSLDLNTGLRQGVTTALAAANVVFDKSTGGPIRA